MTALRSLKNANDATANQRRASGGMSMGKSIGARDDDCRTPTPVVGKYFEDREVRDELSAIVCKFAPRQLAKASGRTIDAAKKWILAERTPDTASTINMARSLPAVSQWLAERCGWRAVQAVSADAVIRWAHEFRNAQGLDGQVARAVLCEVAGVEKKPPAPSAITDPNVQRSWRLIDLREERAREEERRKSSYDPAGAVCDLFLFERRRA